MSNIDPSKPVYGNPTTQSVRDNFQAAHDEITALQAASGTYLPLAGGIMTGAITSVSGDTINGAQGTPRSLYGATAGTRRWEMRLGNATAESGSNAGSSFDLVAYNDSGVANSSPTFTVIRGAGFAYLNGTGATPYVETPTGQSVAWRLNKAASGAGNIFAGHTNGSPRWVMQMGDPTPESGSNAGSDWTLQAFADNGTTIGPPTLTVTRAGGYAYLNGKGAAPVSDALANIAAGNSMLRLNHLGGSNNISGVAGHSSGGARWVMLLGDGAAESGSSAGSNFTLQCFTDAGSYLWSPIYINRGNGSIVLSPIVSLNGVTGGQTNSALSLNKTASGSSNALIGATNAVQRWTMYLGDSAPESGANAGSNFILYPMSDTGGTLPQALSVSRSTGIVAVQTSLTLNWNSASGAIIANTAAPGVPYITISNAGAFTFSGANAYKNGGGPWLDASDARIKNVEGDYLPGLEQVCGLRPVVYSYKGNDAHAEGEPSPHATVASEGRIFVGLIAQEAETVMPEMVGQVPGFIDGQPVDDLRTLDSGPLLFALVNAIKAIAGRLDALEARA
jgi:hypothetical protein